MRNVTERSAGSAVFDATVLIRAFVDEDETARGWTGRLGRMFRVHAPEFLWIEIANALRSFVEYGPMTRIHAVAALELLQRLPLQLHSTEELALPALDAALATGLTPYDAAYLVLAQALAAPLVTFDTHFAGLYDRLELLS
ncbi:MAG: type II toxin-antitoxin system VapC family toxin [Gaiellaceae bacterium]